MAHWKTEAWVTSAVNEDYVQSALVLAESLRKTKTTRQIAVITSMNVSLKNRCALRQVFDLVFLMDESFAPGGVALGARGETQAKVYCFSLTLFEKCVFVSANSLFLESADNLFDNDKEFSSRINADDGSLDTSIFVLKPSKAIWKGIWESVKWNGKEMTQEYFNTWMKNQMPGSKLGLLPDQLVAEFNVITGMLQSENSNAPVVHFVGEPNLNVAKRMSSLRNLDLGLYENTIVWLHTTWMDLFGKASVSDVGTSSQNLPSWDYNGNYNWENNELGYKNEPIAIVGMSCRYPGANTLEEFWNLLFAGQEAIRECPTFRWKKEHTVKVSQQDRKSQAGFLSVPVDEFDARFFGVSPKEAAYMDPQTRLLHEVLWESLEDAGIDPLSLYGSHTGIFTGSWMADYKDIVQGSAERDFFRTYMGNSIGAAAARLSFLLGLTGPSIATESGCSSAIVALDLAVKSLRAGETNLALAGGVNLLLHPFNSDMMEYVISPDGRCKTFDANANGFGRAEGCGVLVLKRLSDALRDRDNIWAMIRGSAVSQEGLSRSLGTPTVHCEALAMQLALEDAGISPDQVSFVETHGTGTSVGDPMEVSAIAKAYHSPLRKQPLVIGSVKTNVGHTESCSGITGVMKVVLALQHELIPKHRNLETLNPEVFLDGIPAIIPMENLTWPKIPNEPRLCGVSSFGITGTDGHVIIQETPDYELPKFTLGLERPMHLMTISGKTGEALDQLLNEYENRFTELAETEKDDRSFANIAFSANVGRAGFAHRTFLVASGYQDAVKILKQKKFLQGEIPDGNKAQLCFLFTGQGSQYPGMAKTLYETSPVFRVAFDRCERTLREKYDLSIKQVLWESEANSKVKPLSRTIYSQTSIFCVEYCLLRLWQSWGIKPDYVLGHSLGEFCAAVAADILTFEDALKLVAERSRLIDNLPQGSMLVVKASQPEVQKWMTFSKIELDFAAVNNPEQTVVAGDTAKVQDFLAYLKGQGTKAIILEASHAFHSRHMDPMLEQYRKIAKEIKYKKGDANIQYISGMEGRLIENSSQLGADYWVRHTREKVSFIEACATLRELDCQNFLEVGPQPVLSSFVMQNNEGSPLNCLPSLRRGAKDWDIILTSLGKLYLLGYQVDWKGFDLPYIRKKVSLPFHPFHRKSFWVECNVDQPVMIHPLVGHPLKNASALSIFQNDLVLKSVPFLKDHWIGNRMVFPGAGFTEMCLSAGYCVANGLTETLDPPMRAMCLENVRIEAPLEVHENKSCRLQVLVNLPESSQSSTSQDSNPGFLVKVYHQQNNSREESGKWVLHAHGTYIPVASAKILEAQHLRVDRAREIIKAVHPSSSDSFYKDAASCGMKFGQSFKTIQKYWAAKQPDCQDKEEIVAHVELSSSSNNDNRKYLLHPLLLDATFQASILTGTQAQENKLRVPVAIGQLTIFPGEINNDTGYMVYCWWEQEKCNVLILDSDLSILALVQDMVVMETNVRTIQSVLEQQSSLVPDAWEETWKPVGAQPFTSSVTKPIDIRQLVEEGNLFRPTPEEDWKLQRETERLLYFYIVDTLQQLGWKPNLGSVWNSKGLCTQLGIQMGFHQLIRFYFTVMQEQGGILIEKDDQWTVTSLLPSNEQIKQDALKLNCYLKGNKTAGVVQIYENVAKSLPKILRGEESSLNILFPQEPGQQHLSADSYYQTHPGRENTLATGGTRLAQLFEKSWFKNGGDLNKGTFRVLEVGSGTGSLTLELLPLLRNVWGNRIEYYVTDISPSFFIKIEKLVEEYRDNVQFAVFNIEQSPLSQGIPLEYFDVVCCTDVLHATRDLQECLVYLRQTLKPGGVISFSETIKPALDITFVFGLLEGYWRFEDRDRRPYHCCVGEQVWKEVLEETGFEQVKCVRTYGDELGVVIAQARGDVEVGALEVAVRRDEVEQRKEWVIFVEEENAEVMNMVAAALKASGFRVTTVWRKQEMEDFGKVLEGNKMLHGVIYGWGMNRERDEKQVALPFLQIAQRLVGMSKPAQLFVVTKGVHGVGEDGTGVNPNAATLWGMAKSLKNECFNMFGRCVDLEESTKPEVMAGQILYELAMVKGSKEQMRVQVAYRQEVRYEPRFVKASLIGREQELKLPACGERYHLRLPESRAIQDLEFEPLEQVEVLGENEVEVKTKAFSLNFKDILTILKPSEEFEKLNSVGLDFAGVVVKTGKNAGWNVGDRVFGANWKEEQLPSHLVLDSRALIRIPDDMTDCEAATLPAVFLTAYHCLINIARMKKGDRVLIHTGSGGVGLAAIQLAKHVGAEIITTAGNSRKRAYLRGLGIEHVFHSRDTSFEQDILRVTNGQGVNIVLNSITGPGIKEATLRCTAKNARFVEMSKLSIWSTKEVKALRPDVEYSIVDLTTVDQETSAKLLETMGEFLAAGQLKAIPFVKFDALNIRAALAYFQKAKHIGKVVCAMPEVSTAQGQFKTEVRLFNSQSTYLITGGLGGIGFEVCKWMLGLGATDIILTGRSAPKPEVEKEIQRLNEKGFNVMVRLGDVGDYQHCKAMIQEIEQGMKPLRGIMHCAGVLRDSLYANQNWANFEATFGPKVKGTWHLHHLTKNLALEHFVVYSSLTALVSTPAQSTHAAANCFEDAFINFRHGLGLPGTTINWGQWAQVGCATEANLLGVLPVSLTRMLNGLELTLRTGKRQVCFCEFDSFANFSVYCPSFKGYLDERLWKHYTGQNSGGQRQVVKSETFWKELEAVHSREEKEGVLVNYLKQIVRISLRLDSEEALSSTANLQELGVDSLMSIELKNSLQMLLGNRLTVSSNMLKNCSTISELAGAVVDGLLEEDGEEEPEVVALEPLPYEQLLDLLKEDAVLPEHVNIAPETIPAEKMSQVRTVMVSGATGKLGPYLVAELKRSYPQVEKILCLVRDTSNKLGKRLEELGVDMERVEVLVGDVTKENLGLKEGDYAELCKNVDAVLHCAAKTSAREHLRKVTGRKRLRDIRSVNVEGTLNILKFCVRGKVKHLFYPSSLICGILGEDGEQSLSDTWPEAWQLDTVALNQVPGLYTSKWIGELLLKQGVERGIPVKVMRFPWIAGESDTGRVELSNNLYMMRFLSFLKLGAMPELVLPANVVPVDICAEMGLKLFMNEDVPNEVFNLSHPQPQVEQVFVQVAQEVVGKQVEILDWQQFLQRVETVSSSETEDFGNMFGDQKMLSEYMADGIGRATGYLNDPEGYFKNQKVSRWIEHYGRDFPQSMETLRKDLSYLKETGVLEKFGVL